VQQLVGSVIEEGSDEEEPVKRRGKTERNGINTRSSATKLKIKLKPLSKPH